MKVKPMIFNTEMVKAILAGEKTVTRRPMNPQPEDSGLGYKWFPSNIVQSMVQIDNFKEDKEDCLKGIIAHVCPIACKGDLIYVRETFTPDPDVDHDSWDDHELSYAEWVGCEMSAQFLPDSLKTDEHCLYKSDCKVDMKWTPSIHMPRWASRLTLKVTDVRIERLQEITEDQCWKEGVESTIGKFDIFQLSEMAKKFGGTFEDAKSSFACLWDSIYKNWDENPYVWVIEFEVIHQNVDKYLSSLD
ncbi:hypothetical protein [Vibrio phage vB_VpaM_XM1]